MKRLFLITLLAVSLNGFTQCTECNSLTEALKKPEGVKSLIINGYQHGPLDSIPASIGLLVNCEILYLSDHPINQVPAAIGKLQKLKELSFGGCKLEKLPEEIFTLKNLKELILFDNAFSENYIKELKKRAVAELPKTKLLL
jgi:Leucine-rich repeat (LRR) protein